MLLSARVFTFFMILYSAGTRSFQSDGSTSVDVEPSLYQRLLLSAQPPMCQSTAAEFCLTVRSVQRLAFWFIQPCWSVLLIGVKSLCRPCVVIVHVDTVLACDFSTFNVIRWKHCSSFRWIPCGEYVLCCPRHPLPNGDHLAFATYCHDKLCQEKVRGPIK